MSEKKKKLTPLQYKAISALLVSKTNVQAAETVGVSYRQLSRWLADPLFQAELMNAESEVVGEVSRRMARLLSKGIDELENFFDKNEKKIQPSDRLRAIRVLFVAYPRLRETYDFDVRLRAVENSLDGDDT